MDENWGLTGHDWAVAMLRGHVSARSARHAYLITGPRGTGRRTLALRFAQALNCESASSQGNPCGTCRSCTRLQTDLARLAPASPSTTAGGHPDLRIVEPISLEELKRLEKDTDDSAGQDGGESGKKGPLAIRVQQVREERKQINLRPFMGAFRVVLLTSFEQATPGAANALLKTLEEAPSHAVLILTAESAEGLLPTIVSRCEVMRLHPVPVEHIQRLLESRGADPERASLVAHISAGRPGAALTMLAEPSLLAFRDQSIRDLLAMLKATRSQKFAYAETLSRDRPSMREVLMIWLSFWRDVLWKSGGASVVVTNIDREHEIEDLAHRLDLSRARHLVARMDRALRQMDLNVNGRLLAEVLLLDLPR